MINNTTYSLKASDINRKWYIIDASERPIGRVAVEAATILRGKHKPTYTPNLDTGDHVIIINCEKAILTGNKMEQKVYRTHSGYIGGLKETKAKDMMIKHPDRAMMHAVKGMIPKNSLGRKMLTKLRVYAGAEHEHTAQNPETWKF